MNHGKNGALLWVFWGERPPQVQGMSPTEILSRSQRHFNEPKNVTHNKLEQYVLATTQTNYKMYYRYTEKRLALGTTR